MSDVPKETPQERFVAVLEDHKRILYKVANAYCRNAADRQDLVQEMVAQLWRSFHRYDERQRFPTWAYRIALNVAISFYRSETRRSIRVHPADESILEIAAPPSESAALEDQMRVMRAAIERLDELDRGLVLLALDGHRHDTIAEILGISTSNVGTRISRIKDKLRRDVARTA